MDILSGIFKATDKCKTLSYNLDSVKIVQYNVDTVKIGERLWKKSLIIIRI